MNYYNQEQIVSVHIKNKSADIHYEYKLYKKGNFFRSTVKEGVYFIFFGGQYQGTKDEFLTKYNQYIIENNVVFEKPKVAIKFTDGSKKEVHFEEFDQALQYGKNLRKTNHLIELNENS